MPRPLPSLLPPFSRPESRVAIRRVANYEADLSTVLFETLSEFDLPVRGKTILLKPNLVGLDPLGMMNTHPAVIAAARESFLRLGAAQVLVGDGPAMDRDTQAVLESIRLREFAGPRVSVQLVAPNAEFTYRPMSVREPFGRASCNNGVVITTTPAVRFSLCISMPFSAHRRRGALPWARSQFETR